MKPYCLLGVFFLICLQSGQFCNAQLPNDEQQAGFEAMLNGKDFTGWEQTGNWKLEEGGIIHRAEKGSALTWTARSLPDDFEMRFEWKVAPGSNSGVYYRPGQCEYQILDNKLHKDGQNPRTWAASLYFCMPTNQDATREVGEWNEARIVCQGSVVQHYLNGKKVVDFDYEDPQWAYERNLLELRGGNLTDRGGNVYLQDHGDEVWYRNFRFREIPETEKIKAAKFSPMDVPDSGYAYEQKFIQKLLVNKAKQAQKSSK